MEWMDQAFNGGFIVKPVVILKIMQQIIFMEELI